jgi:hypothetical protein
MNFVVVYPGRYHPFHKGHKSVYDYLSKKFGADNVYIATSDVQAPVTSPFTFGDKVQMMTKLGIPSGHIVKVKNPYIADEIRNDISDPENTVLVFAVSEKDMSGEKPRFRFGVKKNGEPSYMQPFPSDQKKLEPMTKHAYVITVPVTTFKVQGADADSASAIREKYISGNSNDRDTIIADLYGEAYPDLRAIFDHRLSNVEKTQKFVAEMRRKITTSTGKQKLKMISLLESVLDLESSVEKTINEDIREDYLNEK